MASAMEELAEIDTFSGLGTLAAAAALTIAIQLLPGIKLTGYCGIMLPLCEDQQLAQLVKKPPGSKHRKLEISDLLSISSVCGVGIDTIPLAEDVSEDKLTSLLLDMAGLASRWNKPLSCRVLPFTGRKAGDQTDFVSPYMFNTQVFEL